MALGTAFDGFFSRLGGGHNSDTVSKYLSGSQLALARKLISSGIVSLANQSWKVSHVFLSGETSYPQLYMMKATEKYDADIKKINEELKRAARLKSYEEFASRADQILPRLFAPSVEGLEILREALALQLFAHDPVHILCLADPQVGVGTLCESAITYHPVFCNCDVSKLSAESDLWQGSDGNSPGVLASAHQGIICLQHFEKLTSDQRAAVLKVIDRGYLAFKKDGATTHTPVNCRVLGVVHPLVDSFVGKDAGLIKQQVPFDFSLLSQFHLTFLIQRASLLRFADPQLSPLVQPSTNPLTLPLIDEDLAFIREFVSMAEDRDVLFPKTFQPLIVEWTSKLKSRRQISYLQEVTPNTIIALIRLSQARARMKWRNEVSLEDLKAAMDIVQIGLEIR